MTRIKGFFIIILFLISVLYGASIYEYQKQVKKLEKDKEWLVEHISNLESKDCSWLENYYYNDTTLKENWVIIDGAYYEYKREITPEEQFGEDIGSTLK